MLAKEKVFDDIARVAGGTVSILSGLRQQIREDIRTRIDEMADRLDLVPREDFDRLQSMLVQARKEQQELAARVEALEGKKPSAKTTPKNKTKSKTAKKKK